MHRTSLGARFFTGYASKPFAKEIPNRKLRGFCSVGCRLSPAFTFAVRRSNARQTNGARPWPCFLLLVLGISAGPHAQVFVPLLSISVIKLPSEMTSTRSMDNKRGVFGAVTQQITLLNVTASATLLLPAAQKRPFALCNRFALLDARVAGGVVCWAGLTASALALACPVCQSPRKKHQYGEDTTRRPRFSDPNNRDTEGVLG